MSTPSADVILQATADMFGFTVDEIIGKSRRRPLVTARRIAIYVFRETTDLSYPAIAREFDKCDHVKVIHAIEHTRALMRTSPFIRGQVAELVQQVQRKSAVSLTSPGTFPLLAAFMTGSLDLDA